MSIAEELLHQARAQRELAARLRGLAQGLSLKADWDRLLQQALEIEAEAGHLKEQAAAGGSASPSSPAPPVQQEQVQQQQQHEVEPKPSDRG
jgi:hypothetical protein